MEITTVSLTTCNQIRTQDSETNSEPHNFMETEQLAFEFWMNKQRKEGRNKDVINNQWEWSHNVPESLGHI